MAEACMHEHGGRVVQHMRHDQKVEGLNPALTSGVHPWLGALFFVAPLPLA